MGNEVGRLGLTIAGGVIGAATGVEGGQAIGLIAGSLVGAIVFPTAGPNTIGPRLEDLAVSSSANGNPIPLGAGTMRMPAQVIDATDIQEEEENVDVGGKGLGGGGTATTFKYYANLFLSFGEPTERSIKGGSAVGILKFFADGKMVFDDTKTGLDLSAEAFSQTFTKGETSGDGFSYRFYNGSEAQQPDPFFEDLRGVGNVPAYRGQVCLALERWPLEDHGNRIPIMTAVVAYKGTPVDEVRLETSLTGRAGSDEYLAVNWDLGIALSKNFEAGNADTISVIDLPTLTETRRTDDWTALGRPAGEGRVDKLVMAPLSGRIAGRATDVGPGFGTNGRAVISLDPTSLLSVGRHGGDSNSLLTERPQLSNSFVGQVGDRGGGFCLADGISLFDNTGGFVTHLYMGNGPDLIVMEVAITNPAATAEPLPGNLKWLFGGNDADRIGVPAGGGDWSSMCIGRVLTGATEAYGITEYVDGSNPAALYRFTTFEFAEYQPDTGSSNGIAVTPINTDIGLTAAADEIYTMFPDRTDNTIIVMATQNSLIDNFPRFMKFDMESGDKIWDTGFLTDRVAPTSIQDAAARFSWTQTRVVGPDLCISSSTTNSYTLNTNTGEVSSLTAFPVAFNPLSTWVGDTVTRSIIGSPAGGENGLEQLFCGRLAGDGESLGEINRNIADRVGYDASTTVDVDFSALNATTVPGFAIARQMDAVAAVRPLQQAYDYEIIEIDHKATAVFIDKASAATIDKLDMIAQGEFNATIAEERVQDVEIPARVNVLYADSTLDYQQGAQREQRVLFPARSVQAESEVEISLPISLTAQSAREIAERLLYRGWVERSTISFKTAWEYMYLTPGDVVTLTVDGSTFTVRITQMDVGADNTIEFTGVTHSSTIHTPSSIAAGTDAGTNITQTINEGLIANMVFLDEAPLLRDQDNSATELPLYYGCFVRPGFVSSTIYKQEEAGSWEAIDRCVREVIRGFSNTALPAPPFGAFFTDDVSSFDISIVEGDDSVFVTQSDAQWRNNGLVLLVGSEVISVKTVSVDADTNRITLSNFFRGLLGTEHATDTHTVGEDVTVLSSAHLMHIKEPAGNLSVSNFWRAVTDQQSFELAPIVSHTNTGTALTPLAVAELDAVDNAGDIDITWEPRSRLVSNMRDGVGAYLESEPSEAYEIDILRNGAAIRTLTATTNAVTYTAAQQTTDFGGGAPTISIQVYKTHPVVGRGYVSSKSFTGTGGTNVTRPSIVGTVTEYAKDTGITNLETFNVTPASGAGTTMLCLYIAHASITASGPSDDIRFLNMQGDSFVRFSGTDMSHVDAHPMIDTSTGNFTGLGDLFYLVDPGTAPGSIEVQWPSGLTPDNFIMAAFTIQDVNPATPFGTPRNHSIQNLPTSAAFPTWPSNTVRQVNDESVQWVSWLKDTDDPSLGLGLFTVHDERKLQAFDVHEGGGTVAVDFASASGVTTGDTTICGYRLMTAELEGETGDIFTTSYMTQEFNTTQPREAITYFIEVNGI